MNRETTKPNEINMLAAWIEFLRDPESETVKKSNDETHRKNYEERVKALNSKNEK